MNNPKDLFPATKNRIRSQMTTVTPCYLSHFVSAYTWDCTHALVVPRQVYCPLDHSDSTKITLSSLLAVERYGGQ